MRNDKQLFAMIVFGLVLIFSLVGLYYSFSSNKKEEIKQIAMCIATKEIPQYTKISADFVKEEQTVVSNGLKPIPCKSVIGNYAVYPIIAGEMIINEKLTSTPPKIEIQENNKTEFLYNRLNLPYKMFQNPNYTLKVGDKINIVVIKTNDDGNGTSAHFVAKNIKVIGFVINGKDEKEPFVTQITKTIVNKKEQEITKEIKADELLVDISNDLFLTILSHYDPNNGLWMIQTSNNYPLETVIKKYTQKVEKKSSIRTKSTKSTKKEEYTIYAPKVKVEIKTATIQYDDKKVTQTVLEKNKISLEESCSDRTQMIVTIQNDVHLLDKKDLNGKVEKTLQKNTLLSYTKKIETWYEICDGTFVNEIYVSPIEYEAIKDQIK